jgi:hypothetical protein
LGYRRVRLYNVKDFKRSYLNLSSPGQTEGLKVGCGMGEWVGLRAQGGGNVQGRGAGDCGGVVGESTIHER